MPRTLTLRRRLSSGAAVAAALTLLVAGGPPAFAEENALTWALSPVDKDGQPRAQFRYEAKPGDVVTDTVRLRVLSSRPITFQVYAADAFLGTDGVFDVLSANKPSKDLGSWVAPTQDTVTVPGGGLAEIPFTLTVPDNATPGDHVAGLVTTVSSDVDTANSGTVRLDRRLGSRIYLRVAGPLNPGLAVSDPHVSYHASVNPLGGSSTVSYTVTNTGNTRLQANRAVSLHGFLGGIGGGSRAADVTELLPGSSLVFTDKVGGPRLGGIARAKIAITPREPLAGELPTSGFTAATAATSTLAPAWSQLVLLVLLLGGGAAASVRRRYRAGTGATATSPPAGAGAGQAGYGS